MVPMEPGDLGSGALRSKRWKRFTNLGVICDEMGLKSTLLMICLFHKVQLTE